MRRSASVWITMQAGLLPYYFLQQLGLDPRLPRATRFPLRSSTVVITEFTWVIKCVVKLTSTSRIATT